MPQHGGQSMALLLNAEIAGVLASMRQNSKWSLVPMRYTMVRRAWQASIGLLAVYTRLKPAMCQSICISILQQSQQHMQEDDLGDEPLLEDFRLLRRRIFKWGGEWPPWLAAQLAPCSLCGINTAASSTKSAAHAACIKRAETTI